MNDLIPFLTSLLCTSGISGSEQPVAEKIIAAWRPVVDEIKISPLGSVHALRKGSGQEPRPRLLLSAHMDAIGLMVSGISEGFIRFIAIGGVDARVLPGQIVTVHGRKDLPGVIAQPSASLLPPETGDHPVEMKYLWIDTGLPAEETTALVRVGDRISFAQPPFQMGNELLVGHTLDDRASVAAVTLCLQQIYNRVHAWDVWAVASTQEEVTLAGAFTSPFDIQPDLAVAIDVTFGKCPVADDYRTFSMGKGVALGWGANIHPALYKTFKAIADRYEIPSDMEPLPTHSGTDAMAIQMVAEGIPCMVLSIPVLNMHTPTEIVNLKDIERAGRLMAEFICSLDADYVQKITWED